MDKKLKKNGFIEGSMIAYASIIVTKILGALYSIPFYAIIGEAGGFIYTCAYSIYALVLNASTSGIPTAMSILVSDYNTRGLQRTKRKFYRVGACVVFCIAITLFILLQIFAPVLGSFYMDKMVEGCNVNQIASAIRVMALCLLVAPFLSVRRGYLQGHSFIAPSSFSQVIEQLVRIVVVLAGSFITINMLGLSFSTGVNVALSGAAFGAAFALVYLGFKSKHINSTASAADEQVPSAKKVILRILTYSIPVVIVATSNDLYQIADMKLVIVGMTDLGFSDTATQAVSSIILNWGPKICMIISALSMGLTASLVPNMTASFVKKDYREVNRKFVLAINTILALTVPMALGIVCLSTPVFTLFYGQSAYGGYMIRLLAPIAVIESIKIVVCMSLQSLGRAKLVIVATIAGILANTICDLPLIYLCHAINIPAYTGAMISTVLGLTVTLTIVFVSLKKTMHFRYNMIAKMLFKIFIPNAVMVIAVLLLQWIFPIPANRGVMFFVQLGLYALIGAAIYLTLSYRNGALKVVFGNDTVARLLRRLPLKKFKANNSD